MMTLLKVSQEISRRLTKLFLHDDNGRRRNDLRFQNDPYWNNLLGDTGKGLGANHQTGWT